MDDIDLYVKGYSGGGVSTWAYILALPNSSYHRGDCKKLSFEGTANAAEIYATMTGLQRLTQPSNVSIYSNNVYVLDGVRLLLEHKCYDSNVFLWEQLVTYVKRHTIAKLQHIAKVDNSGYMRLVDSTAFNLLPLQYRRGVS